MERTYRTGAAQREGGTGADRKRGTAENVFDSHSIGTGISSSASSSLSLFLSFSLACPPRRESRSPVYPSRSLTRTRARKYECSLPVSFCLFTFTPSSCSLAFFLSRSFLPFVASRRRSAGRSAPDYLGSECLIVALYRWDSALLAPFARPTPPHRFGGGDTPPSPPLPPPFPTVLPSPFRSRMSFLSFPLSLVPCTHHLLLILLHLSLRLFVYLLVADTSLPRQIYR